MTFFLAGSQSLGLIGLHASKLLIKDNSFAVKLPHLNIMLPKTIRQFQWLQDNTSLSLSIIRFHYFASLIHFAESNIIGPRRPRGTLGKELYIT